MKTCRSHSSMWSVFIHAGMLTVWHWRHINWHHIPSRLFPVCDCRQLHPVIEWIPRGMLILSDHPRALSNLQTSHIGPCRAFVSLMAAVCADIHVSVGDKKAPKSCHIWRRVSRVSSQPPEVKDVSHSKYARGLPHETSWCNVRHIFSHSERFICWFLIFLFYMPHINQDQV